MSQPIRLKASVNAMSDVIKIRTLVHSELLHNVLMQAYIGNVASNQVRTKWLNGALWLPCPSVNLAGHWPIEAVGVLIRFSVLKEKRSGTKVR